MNNRNGAGVARRHIGPLSVVSTLALIAFGAMALGAVAPSPASGQGQTPPAGPANQLVSVVLAKGIKSTTLFGQGELSPVEPTTSFTNTDLPYAVFKFKGLKGDTVLTLRVHDPAGVAFTIDAKIPARRDSNPYETLDVALPLYILGTDLETHTGTWTVQILVGGQPANTTTFRWDTSSPIALGRIRDQVNVQPTDADLHWRYGAALALLHHEREAEAELQNAIRLDQRYPLYYITLGRVYERLNRQADAIKMFKTALSLRSGSFYDAVYTGWAQAHLARLQGH